MRRPPGIFDSGARGMVVIVAHLAVFDNDFRDASRREGGITDADTNLPQQIVLVAAGNGIEYLERGISGARDRRRLGVSTCGAASTPASAAELKSTETLFQSLAKSSS